VTCVGTEAAQRVATFLQLVTVILLVETFMFLPGVLDALVSDVNMAQPASSLPPLWFLGLYAAFSGPPVAQVPGRAALALAATSAALLFALAACLIPAAWNARRALEARLKNRAGRSVVVLQWLTAPVLRQPAARAIFGFILASLLRSRRHAFTVATYLATAVALAGLRLMVAVVRGQPLALHAPADYLLSIPLVLTFFLVVGLRAAFAVPTDVDANWTFRVSQPRTTAPCVHATAVAIVALAVLPVSTATFVTTAVLWQGWSAAGVAVMHAASGVALVELALIGCIAVPFTRAHAPASSRVRFGWIALLVALHVYAFGLDDLQLAAISSPAGVALYVLSMGIVAAAARAWQRRQRRGRVLDFEAPIEGTPASLNLSQALG